MFYSNMGHRSRTRTNNGIVATTRSLFSEFAELDADVSVHRNKLEAIQQSFQAASMASDCDPRVAPT